MSAAASSMIHIIIETREYMGGLEDPRRYLGAGDFS